MKKLFTLLLLVASISAFCQSGGVGISPNGSAPDASAGLDLNFTNKGFLMPRVNQTQENGIAAPALGLQVYNTTTNCVDVYGYGAWQAMSCLCTGAPSAPTVITGNTNPCSNGLNITYQVGLVLGATSYTWTAPFGATIIAGQGSNSVTVNYGSTPGNIGVTANNSCGSSSVDTLPITLSTGPPTPGAISGNDSVDINAAGVVYSIQPVSGADSYNWTVPVGATITANTGTSITVTFGSNPVGTITVSATNVCGTSSQRSLQIAQSSFSATGGDITHVGGHTIYTFTSSGTFAVTGSATVSYLVVGGGGGGGDGNAPGGGGGGGGFVTGTFAVSTGNYTITVGDGGTGRCCDQPGTSGGNSAFGSIIAYGGGNGGGYSNATGGNGGSGGGGSGPTGCGGGGSSIQTSPPGGTGYGNAGSPDGGCSSAEGGGGGGAGGAGSQPNGGPGMASNISGSTVYYAGGGGGGDYPCAGGNTQGIGGVGGGGNGGIGNCGANIQPTAGTANTGGGGGGSPDQTGGNGGSGIVIISY